ncbi:hypothetical protein [Ferruginibacter sp.]
MESITHTNCSNCAKPLPQTGFFCSGCLTQFKCKACGGLLEKDYIGCIYCGTPKEANTIVASASMNTIRIHEKTGERSIEASFSDNIGKELTNMLRDTYTLKVASKLNGISSGVENYTHEEEHITHDQTNTLTQDTNPKDATTTLNSSKIEDSEIMHIDDAERSLDCSETHWILIYAFYISECGKNNFNKEVVLNKYKEARSAGSRMSNFSNKWNSLFPKLIKTIKNDEFRLTDNGINTAKEIITGKLTSQPGTKVGTKKAKGKKEEVEGEKKQVTKKSASGSSGLKRLSNINFYPDGKDSLENFYKKFKVNNDNENNLLFVYYMQEILKTTPLTANHLYTCYHELNIRIPEDLATSIQNTKRRKGWIESIGKGNISITDAGTNKIKFWDKKD